MKSFDSFENIEINCFLVLLKDVRDEYVDLVKVVFKYNTTQFRQITLSPLIQMLEIVHIFREVFEVTLP